MAAAAEALLLAERGELEQAEALARLAVQTLEDLAVVLERAGRTDEACDALGSALELLERKQCLPCAERARAQIDALRRLESDVDDQATSAR